MYISDKISASCSNSDACAQSPCDIYSHRHALECIWGCSDVSLRATDSYNTNSPTASCIDQLLYSTTATTYSSYQSCAVILPRVVNNFAMLWQAQGKLAEVHVSPSRVSTMPGPIEIALGVSTAAAVSTQHLWPWRPRAHRKAYRQGPGKGMTQMSFVFRLVWAMTSGVFSQTVHAQCRHDLYRAAFWSGS